MEQLERNIIKSFKKVKDEIENLQHQILELRDRIESVEKVVLDKEKETGSKKKKK